jgi:ankyrin repeat protein
MTRMWTYQEIKLATNAILATRSGFVPFSTIGQKLKSLALNEAGEDYRKDAPGRYPCLCKTFLRLQRDDELGVSLPDAAFGCGYRKAYDPLDYARALFPTLGVAWKTNYTLSEAMHLLYASQKHHATRLALYHGPPRASLPGWAPATFNGLVDGKIIEPGTWEARGMRRSWSTTKVKSIVHNEPGTLVLALESDFADRALTVGFISEQTEKESPESIEVFKKATLEGNAYLLADEPLVPKRHMSRVGLLVERFTKVEDLQAWVCLTLAVGETEETYKTEKKSWLLLHENPISDEMFSGRGFTELNVDITKSTLPTPKADLAEYPLHEAAQMGDVEECMMLLQFINADTVDSRGWTALHAAAASDQRQIFPLLIQAGAKLDAFDNQGYTPLGLAVDNLHVDAVMELREAGANVNESQSNDGLGFSPLSKATLKGSLEMVNLLLALGAKPSAVDAGKWYPLVFAIRHEEILDALLEAGADPNIPFQDMEYPIHIAAREGLSKSIRTLQKHGADANPSTSRLKSSSTIDPPLYHAIECGSVESVRALLDGNAKCDIMFVNGWSPMMLAAKQGDHEIGRLLLAKGASLKNTNNEGLTPLHIAALHGSRIFYKWLLEVGADENTRDASQRTASDMIKGF